MKSKRVSKRNIGTTSRTKTSITTLLTMVIIGISVAVYFNALFNGFVYDDGTQVLANNWIKDVRFIPDIFSSSVAAFDKILGPVASNYYRPIMHLIYMANYYIFGLKPWGFHLVNIVMHTGVTILVFIIAQLLFAKSESAVSLSSTTTSFFIGLLFATHPIHTEAVTWIASLPELCFSLFLLLSLYFYIRSWEGLRNSYIFSVISFLLATLCKETALTLPIILIVYDYTFNNGKERIPVFVKRYIPYLMVVGVYLIMRFNALGGFAPQKSHPELSMYQYLINIFPLFTQYLEKLILPTNLNAFYVLHPINSVFEATGVVSLCVTVAFIALIIIAQRKDKIAFFGLFFIVIPLLPVLYIPGVGENTFAERYLYLPSFGFMVLLALFLARVGVFMPKGAVTITLIFLVVIGFYSIRTIKRNAVWKDDYILFSDTVKKSPDGAIPHSMLGYALAYGWHTDEAIEQYGMALTLKPYNPVTHNNLGSAYAEKGFIDKAIEEYKVAITMRPDYADAHYNLGQAYLLRGLVDEAIEHFAAAVNLNPLDAEYNSKLAYSRRMRSSN